MWPCDVVATCPGCHPSFTLWARFHWFAWVCGLFHRRATHFQGSHFSSSFNEGSCELKKKLQLEADSLQVILFPPPPVTFLFPRWMCEQVYVKYSGPVCQVKWIPHRLCEPTWQILKEATASNTKSRRLTTKKRGNSESVCSMWTPRLMSVAHQKALPAQEALKYSASSPGTLCIFNGEKMSANNLFALSVWMKNV